MELKFIPLLPALHSLINTEVLVQLAEVWFHLNIETN